MAWFKKDRDGGDGTDTIEGAADSTIEVKASVIADAIADAAAAGAQPPVQPSVPPPVPAQAPAPAAGIASDGLVSGGDFPEPAAEPVADAPGADQALAERRSLVALCLYALDRARSAGVAERLEEGLAGVGVTALRPDGKRFDPAHHEAGGTVSTTDETLDGLVAETEVVGFSDRGELLRAPIVTVYSKAAQ
jgi:molecular chaperone GrpE